MGRVCKSLLTPPGHRKPRSISNFLLGLLNKRLNMSSTPNSATDARCTGILPRIAADSMRSSSGTITLVLKVGRGGEASRVLALILGPGPHIKEEVKKGSIRKLLLVMGSRLAALTKGLDPAQDRDNNNSGNLNQVSFTRPRSYSRTGRKRMLIA